MKIIGMAGSTFVYFCVATVIAQAVGVGMMFGKGLLDENRVYGMLAVVYGLDSDGVQGGAGGTGDEVIPAYEDVVAARVRTGLDHDLREMALDKALGDLRNLETKLKVDRTRYNELRVEFDKHVAGLQAGFQSESLRRLQQILESLPPKQAKDQLLMMIEQDDAMDAAVRIVKSMPADKRKKLLTEFKAGDEPEKLFQILREVRLGMPEVREVKKTQDQLNQLNQQGPQGSPNTP